MTQESKEQKVVWYLAYWYHGPENILTADRVVNLPLTSVGKARARKEAESHFAAIMVRWERELRARGWRSPSLPHLVCITGEIPGTSEGIWNANGKAMDYHVQQWPL